MAKKKTNSYEKRRDAKRFCVLIIDGVFEGLYTNLRELCEIQKEDHEDFPSYWTLARKDKDKPIEFEIDGVGYTINIVAPKKEKGTNPERLIPQRNN